MVGVINRGTAGSFTKNGKRQDTQEAIFTVDPGSSTKREEDPRLLCLDGVKEVLRDCDEDRWPRTENSEVEANESLQGKAKQDEEVL